MKYLDSSHLMLNLGACTALGEIGRNCPLPVPDSGDKDKQPTKKSVIDRLVSIVQTTKSNVNIKVISQHCSDNQV